MHKIQPVLSLAAAIAMLIYALPRLPVGQSYSMQTAFAIVWLGFALLIIASQLYLIIGVNEQKRQRLNQLRKASRRMTAERIMNRFEPGKPKKRQLSE